MNVLIAVSVQVVGMTAAAKEVDVSVAVKAAAIVAILQGEINHADSHIS
jgi:hydrogenase/urease accessory protein HupE